MKFIIGSTAFAALAFGIIIFIKKNNSKMEQAPEKKMMKTVLYTDKGVVSYVSQADSKCPMVPKLQQHLQEEKEERLELAQAAWASGHQS